MRFRAPKTKNFFKNSIVLLVVASFLILPLKTGAVVPVHDAEFQGMVQSKEGGGTINLISKGVGYIPVIGGAASRAANAVGGYFGEDAIVWEIAKTLLRNMVYDLIDWVKYGDRKKPQFITNFGDYLINSADNAAGIYFGELLKDNGYDPKRFCQPFKTIIEVDLLELRKKSLLAQCTPIKALEALQETWEDPIDGRMDFTSATTSAKQRRFNKFYDFGTTGWSGFLTAVFDRSANPIGTYLAAADQLNSIRAGAKEEAQLASQSNQGFLGTRQCVEYATDDKNCEEWTQEQRSCDPSKDKECDSVTETKTVNVCTRFKCSKEKIVTPGTIVEGGLNKALGSPIDTLVAADEMHEILAALIDAIIYRGWYELTNGEGGLIGLEDGSPGFTGFQPRSRESQINNSEITLNTIDSCIMTAGETHTATIEMKNIGTITWTDGSGGDYPHKLASSKPDDNTYWGANRIELAGKRNLRNPTEIISIGNGVKKGETAVFEFDFTAPSKAGAYNFMWQMTQEGIEKFGPITPNPCPDSNGDGENDPIQVGAVSSAEFVEEKSVLPPEAMYPGQEFEVKITMKNNGSEPWTKAKKFKLASMNSPRSLWTPKIKNIELDPTDEIKTGEEKTFIFTIKAPDEPGDYGFQWQMKVGTKFLGDPVPSDNFLIDVADIPPPPPPAFNATSSSP